MHTTEVFYNTNTQVTRSGETPTAQIIAAVSISDHLRDKAFTVLCLASTESITVIYGSSRDLRC